MTIQNFDEFVDETLVKQGKEAFEKGQVSSLEELEDGLWVATVEGATTYEVEILLHKNTIRETSCSCERPRKGVCYHTIVAFLAIEAKKQQKATKEKKGTKGKKNNLKSLFEKISRAELEMFIKTYMAKNKVFKSDFELYFIDKNENNDFEKKITEIIDQTIKPRYYYNYLQNLTDINKEVKKHLKSITTYIGNSNYRDAFIFAKLLFVKLNSIIQEANYLSETFLNNTYKTLDTIIFLAEDERVPLALKEKATSFLIKELYNGTNYEYDYYGNKITEASKRICLQLQKEEEYLATLDKILSKKNLSGYDKRIYTAEKISILSQKGDTEGVNKIIDENLEDPELRKIKIQISIEEGDLKTAKKLLEEGIKTLTQKGRNQNIIKEWKAVLIHIAEIEKDIPTIRHYAKEIALEDKGNIEYYEKWKKTYTEKQWKEVIEKEIKELEDDYNQKRKKISSYWNYSIISPTLFFIYEQEDKYEKLWNYVKELDIQTTLCFLPYLKKYYKEEIIERLAYLVHLFCEEMYTKNDYETIGKAIRYMIKEVPEKLDTIKKLVLELKTIYKRKHNFVEILNQIIVEYKI